jgi:hypothetical protein
MKGGTGVYYDGKTPSVEKQRILFTTFVEHATLHRISRGSFGVTFSLEIPSEEYSPYRFLDTTDFQQPVRKLIVKLCLLKKRIDSTTLHQGYFPLQVYPVTYASFQEEVNIQTNVFFKTMTYMDPVCPAIIFASMKSNDFLLQTFQRKLPADLVLKELQRCLHENKASDVGIIAMEMADGYRTGSALFHTLEKNTIRNQLLFMYYHCMIRFIIETGYIHGDHHFGNVMMKPSSSSTVEAVMLIDFGLSYPLEKNDRRMFQQWYDDGDYYRFLDAICQYKRKDGVDMNGISMYSKVCAVKHMIYHFTAESFNQSMQTLVAQQKEKTRSAVHFFQTQRDRGNKDYPFLPLSNAMKNQLFMGLIEDEADDDVEEEAESVDDEADDEAESAEDNVLYLDQESVTKALENVNLSFVVDQIARMVFHKSYGTQSLPLFINSCYAFVYIMAKTNQEYREDIVAAIAMLAFQSTHLGVKQMASFVGTRFKTELSAETLISFPLEFFYGKSMFTFWDTLSEIGRETISIVDCATALKIPSVYYQPNVLPNYH